RVRHAVERADDRLARLGVVRQKLAAWRKDRAGRQRLGSENQKLLARISALIGSDSLAALEPGEAWSDAALENLQQMSAEESVAWTGLLKHCRKAEASKPTAKWLKEAGDLVEKIGRLQFRSRVMHWFDLVALPRPAHKEVHPHAHLPDSALLICEQNATILRGLAWCCAGWKDTQVNTALANLAEVCFKKIRWGGSRCPRVGNT